jgi:hypothetical protein
MGIQKENDLIQEAFEIEAEEMGFCLDQKWGDYENTYENKDTALAFNLFKKGWQAKSQAAPEGFVLVPEDQAKDTERLNFLLGDNRYIRTVVQRDIENEDYEKTGEHYLFTELYWIDGWDYHENTSAQSERGAIDKAMIEAQEQSHD